MISAREAAYRSLIKCEQSASYTNIEIDSKIKKFGLEGAEKNLYTALVYGVTERKISLDYYLASFCNADFVTLDPPVKVILRIGAYQILYMDRIPQSAAVNEATECARRNAPRGSHNMVNGVLRQLCRNIDSLPTPSNEQEKLSIQYSVPQEIISIWRSSYTIDQTLEILQHANAKPPVTLHVNTLKTTCEALLSELDLCGAKYRVSGDMIVLDCSLSDVSSLLSQGLFYVQDASSQRAVKMLGVTPGSTVIDTCACPGGKSFATAIEMGSQGTIYSFDLHKNKLSLIQKTATKLGIDCLSIAEVDGKKGDENLFGKADFVICDVPCSGLGVIAKKPEIRFKDIDSISRLPSLQYDILCTSTSYLKNGGKLLYSTCTLNKSENDDNVDRFLAEHPDFQELERKTFFPDGTCDGFFASVLQKL